MDIKVPCKANLGITGRNMLNDCVTRSVVKIYNKKKLTYYQVLSQNRAYGHTNLSLLFFYVMLYKTLLEKQQPNSSICCRPRKLTLARLSSILSLVQSFDFQFFTHELIYFLGNIIIIVT